MVEIIAMILVCYTDSTFGIEPCPPCLVLSHAPHVWMSADEQVHNDSTI